MARSAPAPDDAIAARAACPRDIPRIDLAPFRHGDAAARRVVAAAIADACTRSGVFILTGHGVPALVVADAFDAAAGFFHAPLAERQRAQATVDWYRGWIPAPPAAGLSRDSRLFDQYRLQVPAAGEAPNRWPAGRPDFECAITAYLAAMQGLAGELLHAFAMALGLRADRFDAWFTAPVSQLSLFHYPPLPGEAGGDVSSMVPHTDEGPVTILAQHGPDALEVSDGTGGWIAVAAEPGTFTITIGDMMTWWSNARFVAPRHRVRNRAATERLALAFFVNPDRAAIVAPLPELGAPRFGEANVGAHLTRFHSTLEGRPIG